ncbi:uncharacterized protein Gasu_31930 [Galdieria sulphuraria]|uniref:Uncharacterized protein n=1 Tax=Galdieria sulphuraria TaxID=130081 RepID=M2Y0N1_GALSU|nr:uncharacterized protein Gasu_31930 [Galdieria sulphuraria]EME29364.1 hypothetical protein Gasu_31930 [Galdieria sulphuraria]|eukprot:XP_005705884.1 hypothetical protein Gasu_31930 [Galdieria sulphuraria]
MSIPSENIPLDSIIYTNRIPGELCLYDEHKHLAAFVAYPGSKALVIFIAGLTDGLFSPRYWGPMAKALHSQGFTCVQPILSSSYHGFGTSSLDQDVMELDTLIDFLSQHYEPSCIFLIGHSTGCQDAVTFFRKGRNATLIRGIVLQAPVSDRDFLQSLPDAQERLEKARTIYATQGPETLLNGKLFTTVFPVLTARRFLSLAERLGDDDMFSYDLTDDELDSRLRHMRNVPTLALFCEKDEAIPNHISYPELAKRLCNVMGATSYMLSNANHAINNSEQCIRDFIEQVVHFIHKVYSSTSE